MANTYVFSNSEKTIVKRTGSSADISSVPWNPQTNQPNDDGGEATRTWIQDGSPTPSAYVAPPPTAEEVRQANMLADTDRQNFIGAALNATPQQIKNYINNNVTDLATAKQMLIRLALMVVVDLRR